MKESHNKDIKIENKKERHVYGEFKCQFCITLDMDILELKRHMQINHGLGNALLVTFQIVTMGVSFYYLCSFNEFGYVCFTLTKTPAVY